MALEQVGQDKEASQVTVSPTLTVLRRDICAGHQQTINDHQQIFIVSIVCRIRMGDWTFEFFPGVVSSELSLGQGS